MENKLKPTNIDIEKIALQKTVEETDNCLHKNRLTNIIKHLSQIQREDY